MSDMRAMLIVDILILLALSVDVYISYCNMKALRGNNGQSGYNTASSYRA